MHRRCDELRVRYQEAVSANRELICERERASTAMRDSRSLIVDLQQKLLGMRRAQHGVAAPPSAPDNEEPALEDETASETSSHNSKAETHHTTPISTRHTPRPQGALSASMQTDPPWTTKPRGQLGPPLRVFGGGERSHGIFGRRHTAEASHSGHPNGARTRPETIPETWPPDASCDTGAPSAFNAVVDDHGDDEFECVFAEDSLLLPARDEGVHCTMQETTAAGDERQSSPLPVGAIEEESHRTPVIGLTASTALSDSRCECSSPAGSTIATPAAVQSRNGGSDRKEQNSPEEMLPLYQRLRSLSLCSATLTTSPSDKHAATPHSPGLTSCKDIFGTAAISTPAAKRDASDGRTQIPSGASAFSQSPKASPADRPLSPAIAWDPVSSGLLVKHASALTLPATEEPPSDECSAIRRAPLAVRGPHSMTPAACLRPETASVPHPYLSDVDSSSIEPGGARTAGAGTQPRITSAGRRKNERVPAGFTPIASYKEPSLRKGLHKGAPHTFGVDENASYQMRVLSVHRASTTTHMR